MLSALFVIGLIGNLIDPNFDPNGVVLVMLVAFCIAPAWFGYKLDARHRRRQSS